MTKRGKEADLWAQVQPDMMSDEELVGDVYVRHPPSYRSASLNEFVKKLDFRLETSAETRNGAPPRARQLG